MQLKNLEQFYCFFVISNSKTFKQILYRDDVLVFIANITNKMLLFIISFTLTLFACCLYISFYLIKKAKRISPFLLDFRFLFSIVRANSTKNKKCHLLTSFG
jgi:hypothetical protein